MAEASGCESASNNESVASTDTPPPGEGAKGRKSWKELRQVVKNAWKLQMTLANSVPHSFSFRPLCLSEKDRPYVRLYFLGVPPGGRENTLLYVDIPSKSKEPLESHPLPCHPLLAFQGTGTNYTKEEQLLRERKRVGAYGITGYEYDVSSKTFTFSCGSSVYTVSDPEDKIGAPPPYLPLDITIASSGGGCLDPKICPGFPNLICFVRAGDLWVASTGPGNRCPRVKRLTYVEGIEGITAGVVSFVVQEEFDRYTGFWWRPQVDKNYGGNTRSGSAMHLDLTEDEETMTSSVSSHQILYEEVDESGVEVIHIVSSTDDKENSNGYDSYRYPRVGSQNSKSELKLMDFVYDSGTGVIGEVEELRLETPLDQFYPEMEYLVRAGWTPDGKYVWAQVLTRNQMNLALILIHPSCFVRIRSPASPASPTSVGPNANPQAVDEDMLSLDEEKAPYSGAMRPPCGNGSSADGVTSSASPIHIASPTLEDEEIGKSKRTWGMWLAYEV